MDRRNSDSVSVSDRNNDRDRDCDSDRDSAATNVIRFHMSLRPEVGS